MGNPGRATMFYTYHSYSVHAIHTECNWIRALGGAMQPGESENDDETESEIVELESTRYRTLKWDWIQFLKDSSAIFYIKRGAYHLVCYRLHTTHVYRELSHTCCALTNTHTHMQRVQFKLLMRLSKRFFTFSSTLLGFLVADNFDSPLSSLLPSSYLTVYPRGHTNSI